MPPFKRLRADEGGVVSFEYVIVTACVVAGVAAAFNSVTGGAITDTLTGAMSTIGTAVTSAVGG
jgi:pilus assembly protein Flp/PilA